MKQRHEIFSQIINTLSATLEVKQKEHDIHTLLWEIDFNSSESWFQGCFYECLKNQGWFQNALVSLFSNY